MCFFDKLHLVNTLNNKTHQQGATLMRVNIFLRSHTFLGNRYLFKQSVCPGADLRVFPPSYKSTALSLLCSHISSSQDEFHSRAPPLRPVLVPQGSALLRVLQRLPLPAPPPHLQPAALRRQPGQLRRRHASQEREGDPADSQ